MKLKKLVSLFSATALAVSGLTGIATTASADSSVTYTWDFTDSTFFVDGIKSGSTITSDQGEETAIMSNPGAKFALNKTSVKRGEDTVQAVKTEATVTNAMQLDVPNGKSASLSIELSSGSKGKAITLNDTTGNTALTASDYTKGVLKTYTCDLNCNTTYYLDTTAYKAYIGKVALTVTSTDTSSATAEPSNTDTPAETATPAPTDTPEPEPVETATPEPAATLTWTATGSTTVSEANGVYTVTQPASEAAAPVYVDLLSLMSNAPEDITTADGTITVSYDLYRPSDAKGNGDWFVDLSTNTTVSGWSGGNKGTFGRLSGYAQYSNEYKFVPGTGATNGTVYKFENAKDDEWTTVTVTVDLYNKTVKAAMGDDSSDAFTAAYPTELANALYLNVEPSGNAPGNDAVLKFRNISSAYTERDPNAATPEPTAEPTKPVIPEGVDVYKFPGNKATVVEGNQCDNNDTYKFLDGIDSLAKAVFGDPLDDSVIDDELINNYMNLIGGTYGNHPTLTLNIPAGSYKLYFLGFNSGTNPPTATINGEGNYQAGAGVEFAKSSSKTLKLYTMDLELTETLTNASLVLDTTDQFLPDLYAVVIAGEKAQAPAKILPEVTVANIGTYAAEGSDPAAAFTGTFTVGENNYAVNGVKWSVGEKSETVNFTTVSSGKVVVGLIVTGIGADKAEPTAVTVAAPDAE